MKEFKIRASAASQIMTNPRSKSDLLSKTTESYCQDWLKEQIYNRRKEFSSKYTDKGNIVEDNSIDLYAEFAGYPMLLKNEQNFNDDFMTGTPDILLDDKVIDIKSSWDAFTFPLFDTEVPSAYYWQAQVYMHLTGRKQFTLAYCLSDTPEHIIEKEAYYYCNRTGYDFDEKILNEFISKMTYSDVDIKLRIKTFEISYNQDDIDRLIERVKECRTYIQSIKIK